MFPIPAIINKSSGGHNYFDGILFSLPPELRTTHFFDFYHSISKPGWSVDQFGYKIFSIGADNGDLIVFPGLIVSGESKPRKRFTDYNYIYDKGKIEKFARQSVELINRMRKESQVDINLLVHDLRALSSTIYNAALEAQTFLDQRNLTEASVRINNIIATQSILRIRTDALDFVGNPASLISEVEIPVFKKVDKVCRCLKPRATEKNVSISLSGESRQRAHGPDVFEIVPFVFIDNAIKYSPNWSSISVFLRDHAAETEISFESIGPAIDPDEIDKIFEKGYRGRNAIQSGIIGSGLGLHLAKTIIKEHFLGSIKVIQNETQYIGEPNRTRIEFSVTIPSK